ncbi:MAG TPA: 1,4-beta-xylanase [Devosiaceae bacterium]
MKLENVSAPAPEAALHQRQQELTAARWSPAAAWDWYESQKWPCGFNYLPASAVNFIEMWQAETFDPQRMDLELGWAADCGLNSPRTNPQYLVWKADRGGFLDRLDRFLDIAAKKGMKTVLCPMDDCAFGGRPAQLGPQPEPVAGIHNSRAVASPGREIVTQPELWPDVEAYVRDLVQQHAGDERVLFWDLYNEPGNRMVFLETGEQGLFDPALEDHSHRLMLEAFAWCREISPSQPLTVGGWRLPAHEAPPGGRVYTHPTDLAAFELSDIVSFHAYSTLPNMQRILEELAGYGRPLMCTEWMARQAGSRIEEQLPLFCAGKVGAWQWGLVNGRTQTHLPWPGYQAGGSGSQRPGDEWFHDLLHGDGRPYSECEVEFIRRLAVHHSEGGEQSVS